jgi:hypothetical protein
MTLKALLELKLTLIHKTEERRGLSCFRGFPKHSYGMLDQVLVDTLGRCLNGLGNHPELRQEIVTEIRKGTPLLEGLAYGSKFLNSRIAKHGIAPTQGSWADVNLALKIDMRYIDIDGSLERLSAMARSTDGLEAKPWSFPALLILLSILPLKVLDFRDAYPVF